VCAYWLLKSKPAWDQYRAMSTNWISRLAQRLARLHSPVPAGYYGEHDADARRIRTELDAIRVHFGDHA
jgi:hypothetical protein